MIDMDRVRSLLWQGVVARVNGDNVSQEVFGSLALIEIEASMVAALIEPGAFAIAQEQVVELNAEMDAMINLFKENK